MEYDNRRTRKSQGDPKMITIHCIHGNIRVYFISPVLPSLSVGEYMTWQFRCLKLSPFENNCFWENLRRDKPVCKCRRAIIRGAKITLYTVLLVLICVYITNNLRQSIKYLCLILYVYICMHHIWVLWGDNFCWGVVKTNKAQRALW